MRTEDFIFYCLSLSTKTKYGPIYLLELLTEILDIGVFRTRCDIKLLEVGGPRGYVFKSFEPLEAVIKYP